MLTLGAPQCNTTAITAVFAPTGWRTVALEQVTFRVADPDAEAAFYQALMGWTLRRHSSAENVLDAGAAGSVVFKRGTVPAPAGGRGPAPRAIVESMGYVIEPWDAKAVERALRERGLAPVADNGPDGFESFHVKDPDGLDLQVCNGNGLSKQRRTPAGSVTAAPAPFESTGWRTVWLDHLSYSVADYKKSASFYMNLLGWKPTYDEGSQHELLIGDLGDVIIRGGNPLDPAYSPASARAGRIDHISFGIAPWDTDGVKAQLETRKLKATIDTSSRHQAPDGTWVPDDIHTAAFKSYHTDTPNGYNLQISYITRDTRLNLSNAVRPRSGGR